MAIAEAIKKAGSTDTEKLIKAFRGLTVETVFGPITFRALDQQSTFGAFVGRLDLKGEQGRRWSTGATSTARTTCRRMRW